MTTPDDNGQYGTNAPWGDGSQTPSGTYPTQPVPQQYPGAPGGDTAAYPTQNTPYMPGQAAPAYGPPAYGPPGDAFGAPGYGPPPKQGMSGGVKAMLIVLPIVVIAAIVVAVFALGGNSTKNNTAADSTPPAASQASTPPSTPPSTLASAAPTDSTGAGGGSGGLDTFTLPSSVIGLPKSTDKDMESFTDSVKGIGSSLGGTPVAGAYGSNPLQILLLVGLPTNLATGDLFTNAMFQGMGSEMNLGAKKSYSAGSMGGALNCANGKIDAGSGVTLPVSVCSVSDDGGVLIAIRFNKTASQLAAEMPGIRAAVEKQP